MTELTRRAAIITAASTLATAAIGADTRAWDFTFPSLDGGTLDLATLRGRVLLVVNTASFCGFTYQYEGLEKMHAELTPSGLTVVGIPSQDFNQEKGTNGEVKEFCELTYGVKFPMSGIAHVRGPAADPFYRWVKARDGWEPEWNFNKVLIARDGTIVAHYSSNDEPGGARVRGAVNAQLAAVS